MSWTDAVLNIKTLLDEGDSDKLVYRKKCFGELNGTNLNFKTFEFRRVTDFTSAEFPLGVWINGALLSSNDVTDDFKESGDFQLKVAPVDGDVVEASYYHRWFTDDELIQFLVTASQWLAFGSDYTATGEGFRPSALKYAASEAYQKLALRWARRLSEGFLLNDAPATDQVGKMIEGYTKAALDYRAEAEKIRDDYYSRSGQQKQPLFGFALGTVQDNVPKR